MDATRTFAGTAPARSHHAARSRLDPRQPSLLLLLLSSRGHGAPSPHTSTTTGPLEMPLPRVRIWRLLGGDNRARKLQWTELLFPSQMLLPRVRTALASALRLQRCQETIIRRTAMSSIAPPMLHQNKSYHPDPLATCSEPRVVAWNAARAPALLVAATKLATSRPDALGKHKSTTSHHTTPHRCQSNEKALVLDRLMVYTEDNRLPS